MVALARVNGRQPANSKRRRRKKTCNDKEDEGEEDNRFVDTDVTAFKNPTGSTTTSLYDTTTSVGRTPKSKRALQGRHCYDDVDDGYGVLNQSREQRRKVCLGKKLVVDALETEDTSRWKSVKPAENCNGAPVKKGKQNVSKKRICVESGKNHVTKFSDRHGIKGNDEDKDDADTTNHSFDDEDLIDSTDSKNCSSKYFSGSLMPSLKSKETTVVYIQKRTGPGFAHENKGNINKGNEQFKMELKLDRKSDLDFFLKFHKIFQRVALLIHGLLAGIAISHLVFIYALSHGAIEVLLRHYYELALPYHSVYFFLLVICCVSIFDRYINVSSGWGHFFSVLSRNPVQAFALIFYVFSLIFSAGLAQLDNRISMYICLPELWKNNVNEHVTMWKIVCVLRALGVVLGWLMVCFTPHHDETYSNIKESMRKGEADVHLHHPQLNHHLQQHIPSTIINWDGIKGLR